MTAKNSLRIKSDNIVIEVNDQGETITLPFGDQAFPNRVFELIAGFEQKKNEIAEKTKEIEEQQDIVDSLGFSQRQKDMVDMNLQLHEYFKFKTDEVFGAETCRKVFGDIVPSLDAFARFFDALSPYFEKHAKQRNEKLGKYNAGRTGNV